MGHSGKILYLTRPFCCLDIEFEGYFQAKIDLLRVSRASLLSNAMGPLYKHEFEVAKRLGELFEDAANGITETTSGDYDFKILKELRSDYEGPTEEQPVSPEEEQRQEQAIEGKLISNDLNEYLWYFKTICFCWTWIQKIPMEKIKLNFLKKISSFQISCRQCHHPSNLRRH